MKFVRLLIALAFIGRCSVEPPGLWAQDDAPAPPPIEQPIAPSPKPSPVVEQPVQPAPVAPPMPAPAPQPAPQPTPEVDAIAPEAIMSGPMSARLGEMVVMRTERPTNVDYCEWSIEPEPASLEIVDVTAGRGKSKKVIGVGQECHWSSTSIGIYTVLLIMAGSGGIKTIKRRVAYGTIVDSNVLAPAEENMAIDNGPQNLETALLRSMRSIRSGNVESERKLLGGVMVRVAAEIRRGNIQTPKEMSLIIKRLATNQLGEAFGRWVPVLQTFSQGLSDSAEQGLLPTMEDHAKACEAAGEFFGGEQ